MRRILLATLIAALTPSCHACGDASTSPPSGDAPATAARPAPDGGATPSAAEVESFRARARVPAIGWAAVGPAGQTSGAVGTTDLERASPATDTTAFEAASIAKTIIATCVLQLVEERRLALDADVSQYVGFAVRHPRRSRAITLRHLLTHTASVADLDETRAPGTIALGDFLASYFADGGTRGVFLDRAPGTAMAYSNAGAALAALAVERVSGAPFADRARTHVFEPLGMRATAFGRDRLRAPVVVASPHAARGSSFVRLPPPSHALYPVVDLLTTPRDLVRFARAVLGHGVLDGVRILAPASVDEMLRVQLPDAAPGEALGWQVRTLGGRRLLGHEGEDLGASTGLYLDVAAGTAAVVLANGDAFQSGDDDRARALGDLVVELLDVAGGLRASAPR